jgi:putative DNA primase/helicase
VDRTRHQHYECAADDPSARRERPELRQFRRDPVTEVLSERGLYVGAALTIVRAYIVAGRPSCAPRMQSFEGWSDTLRSALIWLGCPDPVETMETARRDDPTLQAMEAVFAALKDALGVGREYASSAAEIIQRAYMTQSPHPGLKEALLAVAGRGGFVDARELGKWFSTTAS